MQAPHFQEPPSHRADVRAKVDGHPGLERHGVAVVNTDTRAYKEARARRRAIEERDRRIADLERSMTGLNAEISELKGMLKCLLDRAKS